MLVNGALFWKLVGASATLSWPRMAGPPGAAAALRAVMPAPAAPTAAAVATRNRLRRDDSGSGADISSSWARTSASSRSSSTRRRDRSSVIVGAPLGRRLREERMAFVGPRCAVILTSADTRAGPPLVAHRVEPVTEGGHMAEEQHDTIDDLSTELRRFPPPDGFKAEALVTGTELYDEAAADDEGFWARRPSELITWSKPWETILEWDLPYAKWFGGGELNVSYNCLDRHVEAGRGDKVAFHWEGEPGDSRTITYAELLGDVQRFANVLKSLGVAQGRPGQHLHADDPRGGGRDAGVRAHRCRPQRRLRRVLGAGARRSDQRRRGDRADHRRRRLPARRGVPAQGGGRRGRGRTRRRSSTSSSSSVAATTSRWSTAATTGTTS